MWNALRSMVRGPFLYDVAWAPLLFAIVVLIEGTWGTPIQVTWDGWFFFFFFIYNASLYIQGRAVGRKDELRAKLDREAKGTNE